MGQKNYVFVNLFRKNYFKAVLMFHFPELYKFLCQAVLWQETFRDHLQIFSFNITQIYAN